MTNRTVYINNQRVLLQPAQLIQAGGEGMVFGVGATAVKLYHAPQPQHVAKLMHLCQSGLAARLPAGLLAPQALATDRQQRVVGFQMVRLPGGAVPLKKFAMPLFWQKNNLAVADVLALFLQMHQTLAQLHRLGVVVGDLNDQNVHVVPANLRHAFWLDVDSYQIDPYPCPVAALPFLDPELYGVADFGQRPSFTPDTDWYAYFVLLLKSVLHAHPYGGTHPQHKSLQARAQAGVTLADGSVTYPHNARPLETLSDELLHHLHGVFARGQRGVFPAHLLAQYAADLTTCTHCGMAYPRQRAGCPACRRPTPLPPPLATGALRQLLRVDGVLEYVRILGNGRILAISHHQNSYTLHRLGIGGMVKSAPLFNGRTGYRFALFQPAGTGPVLAVNPPGGAQLLLLDMEGAPLRRLALLETGFFRETAVFAATPAHLFRIAGSWMMRGTLRDGLYVEDAVATAHQNQTHFWASPYAEMVAGYHRIFAEVRTFLWHKGASYDVTLPSLQVGERVAEMGVVFAPGGVAFWRKLHGREQVRVARGESFVVNGWGEVVQQMGQAGPFSLLPPEIELDGVTAVHHHPQGFLLQKANRLMFISVDPSIAP